MSFIKKNYHDWFFSEHPNSTLSAVRFFLGLYVIVVTLDIIPVSDLLLTSQGVMPSGLYALPDNWIKPLLYLLIFLGATLAASFQTRITTALIIILFWKLIDQNPYIWFGAEHVAYFFSIWTLFLRSPRQKLSSSEWGDWPIRAIQAQTSIIYVVTGIKKLITPTWQNGTALHYAIQGFAQYSDASWLGHKLAPLFRIGNYFTLVIEILFPIIWISPFRLPFLAMIFTLHLGIDLLFPVRGFSIIMMAGLCSFLNAADWLTLGKFINSLKSLGIRFRAQSKPSQSS